MNACTIIKSERIAAAARSRHARIRSCGFTLIEAVLALAVSSVVLAAIGGVFYSALRMRNRSEAMIEQTARVQPALAVLKRDLTGAMQPDGILSSGFRCGDLNDLLVQGPGVEFVTTSAPLREHPFCGDLQQVAYVLKDSPAGRRSGAKDLVRIVSRNLLATALETPEEELLLPNVDSFEVECYNGYEWRNSWDTSLTDTNLPMAVRINLALLPDKDNISSSSLPSPATTMQFVIPLSLQSRTNIPADSAETEGGQT